MSGIEVAGLVLGAFPILLAALESYREGAETVSDWWRIKRAYTKCKQDLEYHQILFEGNIERFLLPLVVDDEELKLLMADPAGEDWEDAELERRLCERLPKSYKLFLSIMGNINELMESLQKELGVHNRSFQARVDQNGKLERADASLNDLLSLSNIEFQAKRIRFSLKKSSRQRLFEQLEEANRRLRNLLESSDQVVSARRTRQNMKKPSTIDRKLNEFWRHAKRLHDALYNAWQCGCTSHIANLQLQHRTSDNVEFDVIFSTPTHGKWQDTKIRMLPNTTVTRAGVAISIRGSAPTPSKGVRQVRWTEPNIQDSPVTQLDHMQKIEDLCSALSMQCPDCFGFVDEDEHRFVFYQGSHIAATDHISTITLDTLLDNSRNLTRRKRCFIALTLASSYLQLGSTPWLNTPLQKDSIVFLHDPLKADSTALDHPYIRREMTKSRSALPADAISSLGIRLLELCFGYPLEKSQYRKNLGPGDAISAPILDYAAAIQWSKMANEEAGPEFAEAIDWCLHARELSDGSWRKEIWSHVIVPLEACHKHFSQRLLF